MRRIIGIIMPLLLWAGDAQAADLIAYPTSANQSMPVTQESGFDWRGFYAGVYGAAQRSSSSGDRLGIGIDAGVNTTFNFVLAGAEIAVTGLDGTTGTTAYAQATGRAGLLVSDNAVLYGAAGYGLDTGTPASGDVLAGGGVEFAATDNVSLRAQYLHGFSVTGVDNKDQVTLGAQFHF